MFTLGGFYESIDGGGAEHNIAAMADQHLTYSGDNLRVPKDLPNLFCWAGLLNVVTYTYIKFESPSLNRVFPVYTTNINAGVNWGAYGGFLTQKMSPVPLVGDEDLQCLPNTDAAGAVAEYGFVWFCDGPLQPVTGQIYTLRGTTTITNVAGTWVNGAITFNEALPYGRYQVVGMSFYGDTTIAGRLVFVGGTWRPGVMAVNTEPTYNYQNEFRYGNLGVWGEFDSTSPPSIDSLGSAGASQVVLLDVIKVA